MFAVYHCGCTDCFLSAIFRNKEDAEEYLSKSNVNPEGGYVTEWKSISDIDTTDTGWGN